MGEVKVEEETKKEGGEGGLDDAEKRETRGLKKEEKRRKGCG